MTVRSHGISIGLERKSDYIFLTLKARGKLTHGDYETMVPILRAAIEKVEQPKINVFMDARELEGWEPRAAWDDFKLGMEYGRAFNRIAVLSDKRWIKVAGKVGGWFIGGEFRTFTSEAEAMAWLEVDS
ncbi:STAS/SEC14 domain-containing protein [Microbulbifer sp. SSSA002]|uniref:STAS/SEC14 domain-containing protein n=1 Tax=unclassified Microbulbifer TaxID=2619833 RepID=UPI0040397114